MCGQGVQTWLRCLCGLLVHAAIGAERHSVVMYVMSAKRNPLGRSVAKVVFTGVESVVHLWTAKAEVDRAGQVSQ